MWFANLLVLVDAVGSTGVERLRRTWKAKRSAAENSLANRCLFVLLC